MPTHAIGQGKVNVSVTLEVDDARTLGRLAFVDAKSRNEWVRTALADAVKRRLRELAEMGVAFVFILGAAFVIAQALSPTGPEMRRGRETSVRIARAARRAPRREGDPDLESL